jgi:chromosome condensin MukBEF MukE localization factor
MIFTTAQFAEIDTALRRGRHISRSEIGAYEFITQNYDDFELFYSAYGVRLIQHPDGFFFLLAKGSLMPTRMLPRSAMHLGMFIAFKRRDPDLTRSDGRMSIAGLIQDLETSVPAETLAQVYAPKQKASLEGERIHTEVMRALKVLADLDFIEINGDQLIALEAINRFAELAKHSNAPTDTAKLGLEVQRGVVFDITEEIAREDSDDSAD